MEHFYLVIFCIAALYGAYECQPIERTRFSPNQYFQNGTQRVNISPHPGRDTNEADINKDLGFKDDEEKFEHMTKGKTRDIKIGIRLWKKRKGRLYIPYEISDKFSWERRQKLKKAIAKMNGYLECNEGKNVWIKRNPKKHKHFVKFEPGPGCSSTVGKSKWRINYIKLHNACIDNSDGGVILHEMMHSMGFYHEMQRGDRDEYIQIYYDNIQEGMLFNFHKFKTHLTTVFDFESVMMYPFDAFSKNGQKTFESKHQLLEEDKIGQRNHLSDIDIRQVNGLYECGDYKPVIPK